MPHDVAMAIAIAPRWRRPALAVREVPAPPLSAWEPAAPLPTSCDADPSAVHCEPSAAPVYARRWRAVAAPSAGGAQPFDALDGVRAGLAASCARLLELVASGRAPVLTRGDVVRPGEGRPGDRETYPDLGDVTELAGGRT